MFSDSWYTPPEPEGPLCEMWRQLLAAEIKMDDFLESFIASIPEDAASWRLFTRKERKRWGIKGYRKR